MLRIVSSLAMAWRATSFDGTGPQTEMTPLSTPTPRRSGRNERPSSRRRRARTVAARSRILPKADVGGRGGSSTARAGRVDSASTRQAAVHGLVRSSVMDAPPHLIPILGLGEGRKERQLDGMWAIWSL